MGPGARARAPRVRGAFFRSCFASFVLDTAFDVFTVFITLAYSVRSKGERRATLGEDSTMYYLLEFYGTVGYVLVNTFTVNCGEERAGTL